MPLYKYTPNIFSEIKEKPFQLEREIQRMFEANLPQIMGLETVKSEFTIKDYRIDTLAFDPQSKAFVIIEYKKERNQRHRPGIYLSESDVAKPGGFYIGI